MERLSEDHLELINQFLGEPDELENLPSDMPFKQAWRDIWAWLGACCSLHSHYLERWRGYFG